MTPALVTVQCPYCWENFEIEVEPMEEEQEFTQDCEVCCRPIAFTVGMGPEDEIEVSADRTE